MDIEKTFLDECLFPSKCMDLLEQYEEAYTELFDKVKEKAFLKEYANGSIGLHGGYYSPSCLDLVIGGCKRGKLLKRITKTTKYEYEYIFDKEKQLISINYYIINRDKQLKLSTTELFVEEGNKVISFVYSHIANHHSLDYITERKYVDGLLKKFEIVSFAMTKREKRPIEISIEELDYKNERLDSLIYYQYRTDMDLLTRSRYIFTRDSDGFLDEYKIEEINKWKGDIVVRNSGKSYKVLVKRK